jgi:hypothetical protein
MYPVNEERRKELARLIDDIYLQTQEAHSSVYISPFLADMLKAEVGIDIPTRKPTTELEEAIPYEKIHAKEGWSGVVKALHDNVPDAKDPLTQEQVKAKRFLIASFIAYKMDNSEEALEYLISQVPDAKSHVAWFGTIGRGNMVGMYYTLFTLYKTANKEEYKPYREKFFEKALDVVAHRDVADADTNPRLLHLPTYIKDFVVATGQHKEFYDKANDIQMKHLIQLSQEAPLSLHVFTVSDVYPTPDIEKVEWEMVRPEMSLAYKKVWEDKLGNLPIHAYALDEGRGLTTLESTMAIRRASAMLVGIREFAPDFVDKYSYRKMVVLKGGRGR